MDKQRYIKLREKCIDAVDRRFKALAPRAHEQWTRFAKNWLYRKVYKLQAKMNRIRPRYNEIKDRKDLAGDDKRLVEEFSNCLFNCMTCLCRIEMLDGGSGVDWFRRACERQTGRDMLNLFLELPLSRSMEIMRIFSNMEGAVCRGVWPARFVYIPGKRRDRVQLVAHADTVWDDRSADPEPNKFMEDNGIYRPSGLIPLRGLGADDRAGCALLWALKDLGHSLLITDGEERGRLGSRFLMEDPANRDIAEEINRTHGFVVQFDRRNSRDFKCYDVGTDEFRSYMARKTGYTEPDRSSFTDITTLCRRIPGVNLSIGFYNEHTAQEYLVFEEWMNTLSMAKEWLSGPLPRFSLHKTASAVQVA